MRLFPFFRKVALLEGVSYVLFGITMPLKYIYGILEPNFYVGMAHGLLFMVYCFIGLTCAIKFRWSFLFSFGVFIASLIPFGTFYLEAKHLRHLDH
jgi:integral membrane protein